MEKSVAISRKKSGQITIGVGILLIISGVVYLIVHSKKGKSVKRAPDHLNPTAPFRCTSNKYPLSFGTCHRDVKIIQRHLKALGADLGSYGKADIGIDGRFGALTLKAAQAKLGKSSFDRADVRKLKSR